MTLNWQRRGERTVAFFDFRVPRGTTVYKSRFEPKDGGPTRYSRFVLDRKLNGFEVCVEVGEKELIALAVRAMNNKGKRAKDGALRVLVLGFEPSVELEEEEY